MLYIVATRMMRATRTPPPLLLSSQLDYRVGMLTDGGVMISFALAWAPDEGSPASLSGRRPEPWAASGPGGSIGEQAGWA